MKKNLFLIIPALSSFFYSQNYNIQIRDDTGALTVTSGFYQARNYINNHPCI